MYSFKPGCLLESYEKLRSVLVTTAICHRKQSSPIHFYLQIFIRKKFAINTLSSRSVPFSNIATLGHKISYYAVKGCSFIAEIFLVEARDNRNKVFDCFRTVFVEKFELHPA